jgi:predicted nucleic acid binding AN1-type Zn finger protein
MTTIICQGKIKLDKKYIGIMDDGCHNSATEFCEDCGKHFCHRHINRDKHECDDSVKGCHGTLA